MNIKTLHRSSVLFSLLTVGLLLTALTAVGCATNVGLGTQVSDAELTSRVKARLAADPEVNPFEIDVDTSEGDVRLSGLVETEAARREAVHLAADTQGVVRVIDGLQVGDKTMAENLTDAAITTKVKAKLTADPELNPLNIDVDTLQGVVTLSGKVETASKRVEAEKLAMRTDGVKRVDNRLEVEEGGR